MASRVIAGGVLPEVILLLMESSPACRDQANPSIALSVSHKQQDVAFRHTEDDKPRLAIVLTIGVTFDGEF